MNKILNAYSKSRLRLWNTFEKFLLKNQRIISIIIDNHLIEVIGSSTFVDGNEYTALNTDIIYEILKEVETGERQNSISKEGRNNGNKH